MNRDWLPPQLRDLLLALNFLTVALYVCAALVSFSIVPLALASANDTAAVAARLSWHGQLLGIVIVCLALRRVVVPTCWRASRRIRFAALLFVIALLLFPDSVLGMMPAFWLAFMLEPVLDYTTGFGLIVALHGLLILGSALDLLPVARRLKQDFGGTTFRPTDGALGLAWLAWLGTRSLCAWLMVIEVLEGGLLVLAALELVQVVLLVWTARRVWSLIPNVEARLGEHLCPHCWYDLRGSSESGCPECGWRRAA